MSMNFPEDMTFAPGFSSTRNFTKEAAHLISTPFNPSADMAAFPAPPVSTIKVGSVERLTHWPLGDVVVILN